MPTTQSEFFPFELEQDYKPARIINGEFLVLANGPIVAGGGDAFADRRGAHGSHSSHQSNHSSHSSHSSGGGW